MLYCSRKNLVINLRVNLKAAIQFAAFFLMPLSIKAAPEPVAPNTSIFVKQSTQDLYETAVAQLIKNTRLSEKNIDKCLESEPTNDQCQFLKLNIENRKSPVANRESIDALRAKILDQESDLQFYKQVKELEKKIEIKNYSLARQMLDKLEKDYPDYPDLIIFKRNLNFLSSESDDEPSGLFYQTDSKAFEIYQKRCESIDPMTIRKYIYDLDLCNRKQAI